MRYSNPEELKSSRGFKVRHCLQRKTQIKNLSKAKCSVFTRENLLPLSRNEWIHFSQFLDDKNHSENESPTQKKNSRKNVGKQLNLYE